MAPANRETSPRLSPSERKVLALILQGKSLKVIAVELKINAKTVSTYKSRIMAKLHVESNVELVIQAMLHFGMGGIYLNPDK